MGGADVFHSEFNARAQRRKGAKEMGNGAADFLTVIPALARERDMLTCPRRQRRESLFTNLTRVLTTGIFPQRPNRVANVKGTAMSPEILTIIGVGIALAALILTGHNRINKRIERLENRFEQRMGTLEQRVGALEQRVARLEGLMEGIREALFDRVAR